MDRGEGGSYWLLFELISPYYKACLFLDPQTLFLGASEGLPPRITSWTHQSWPSSFNTTLQSEIIRFFSGWDSIPQLGFNFWHTLPSGFPKYRLLFQKIQSLFTENTIFIVFTPQISLGSLIIDPNRVIHPTKGNPLEKEEWSVLMASERRLRPQEQLDLSRKESWRRLAFIVPANFSR